MNKNCIKNKRDFLRLGCGSAFAEDRIEPAIELCEKGDIDYIIFDSIAEASMVDLARKKIKCPNEGYDFYIEKRFRSIIPICNHKKIKKESRDTAGIEKSFHHAPLVFITFLNPVHQTTPSFGQYKVFVQKTYIIDNGDNGKHEQNHQKYYLCSGNPVCKQVILRSFFNQECSQ